MKTLVGLLVALAAVFVFESAADAQLPKQGTWSGMYYKSGTVKALPIGDQIVILVIDESGMVAADSADSPLNNNSLRCVGTGRFLKSIGHFAGQCMFVDPAGDQFIIDWNSVDFKLGEAPRGPVTFLGGTGKFKGITGTGEWEANGSEIRSVTEGTYQGWSKLKYYYKLP